VAVITKSKTQKTHRDATLQKLLLPLLKFALLIKNYMLGPSTSKKKNITEGRQNRPIQKTIDNIHNEYAIPLISLLRFIDKLVAIQQIGTHILLPLKDPESQIHIVCIHISIHTLKNRFRGAS
jgi:hypothetical protein